MAKRSAPTMLEEALAYAANGWPVFPCHPGTKAPLVKAPTDPETKKPKANAGGVHLATTDETQIRAWWTKWPKAMIGVAMGARAGVFAIDLDLGDPQLIDGVAYLEKFREHMKWWGDTAIADTASGGVHIYFAYDPQRQFKNGVRICAELSIKQPEGAKAKGGKRAKDAGVDVRTDGGYVIVPPSVREDGACYSWRHEPWRGIGTAPDTLWAELMERARDAPPARSPGGSISERAAAARDAQRSPTALTSAELYGREGVRKYALSALEAEKQAVAAAVPGERNNRLNVAAIKLGELVASQALSEREVRAALEDAAELSGLANDDGWPSVRATLDSGLAKGLRQPRDLSDVAERAVQRQARQARRQSAAAAGAAGHGPHLGTTGAPGRAPLDLDPPPFEPPADRYYGGDPPAGPAEPPPAFDGSDRQPGPSSRMGASAVDQPPPREQGARRARRARAAAGRGKQPPASKAELDLQLAFFPHTDLGNVQRFVERNRGQFLWCPAFGWLWWDGRRWAREGAEERIKIAEHECVRAIQDEAEALAASAYDAVGKVVNEGKKNERTLMLSDMLSDWGRASEQFRSMQPLNKRAQGPLAMPAERFDADPFTINVLNGTLRISPAGAVDFADHDPEDYITKLAPVEYEESASCPEFDKFIERVQPKKEMQRFLDQWGGYSSTGDISEQVFTFHWGKGKNGKSTLLNAWADVLGDYGASVQIETFLQSGIARSGGQPTPDLAKLKGIRFLRTSEPERGAKLAEALVKLATGGEPLSVRHLNREFFDLTPAFKLTMAGNYQPKITGTDEGIWRRTKLVPWLVTIPVEERDKHFGDKLKAERSGIFNRLLRGLKDWLQHGLIDPPDVVEATNKYREASDPLGRFLKVCVQEAVGERVQSSRLHELFVAWAAANGASAWSNKGLSQAMDERGYQRKHSDVMYWLNIKLIKNVNDYVDHEGKPIRVSEQADDDGAPPARGGRSGDDAEF